MLKRIATWMLVLGLGLMIEVPRSVADEGPVLRTARGESATRFDGTGAPIAGSAASDPSALSPHQILSDQIRARIDVAEAMRRRAVISPARTGPQSLPPAEMASPPALGRDLPPPPLPQDSSVETALSDPLADQPLADAEEGSGPEDSAGDQNPPSLDLDEEELAEAAELSPQMLARHNRIRRVLDIYYERPLDAGRNDVWEVMHAFLAYGVDGRIKTSQYREPVNAIGWVCWNRPCKNKQLFLTRGGKLEAKQGPGVQGHHGQFLAMLAQCFVSKEYEIHVDGQTFTVEDLIEFEKATCRPRTELTFKLIALCHYLPMDATWKSNDGRQWDLELLLREELAQNVVGAACGGTHRLAGIGMAVKKRKSLGLPMDGTWAKAEEYMQRYKEYTFSLQNRDGSFSTSWFEQRGMDPSVERRLQTTGHILEYLLLTGDDELLADPRVLRAVDYLTNLLESQPRRNWSIGPQGHALHALAIFDRRVFGTEPGHRNRLQQFVQNEQQTPAE